MDKLKKSLETTGPTGTPVRKVRAVGSSGSAADEEKYRKLIIDTAKTVVGVDAVTRRHHGLLSCVALLTKAHPYLETLLEAGRNFERQKKELKESGRAKAPAESSSEESDDDSDDESSDSA